MGQHPKLARKKIGEMCASLVLPDPFQPLHVERRLGRRNLLSVRVPQRAGGEVFEHLLQQQAQDEGVWLHEDHSRVFQRRTSPPRHWSQDHQSHAPGVVTFGYISFF